MIEGDGKQTMKVMMMMMVMIMVIGGQLLESTQSTDDGFAEYILESSDVLIKQKTDSLYILETTQPPLLLPPKNDKLRYACPRMFTGPRRIFSPGDSKVYMPKKVQNIRRIINDILTEIGNIVFSRGKFPLPPVSPLCTVYILNV